MKELSRRRFGKLLAASLGGAIGAKIEIDWLKYYATQEGNKDKIFKIEFDQKEGLSYQEAAALAERLSGALQRLTTPELKHTNDELIQLALELLPQYEYEGIVSESRYPNTVEFHFWTNGEQANHVLGQSDCQTYAVENGRIELSTSTWGKDEEVFTLAHELAHVQQGSDLCRSTETSLIENSAQIAAMEVVCGLANQGNPMYLWAAVNELFGMALSSAMGLAMSEGKFDEFKKLRSRLKPGAFSEARFAKSQRRYADNQERLWQILDWYNITPLNMIIRAIRKDKGKIEGLAFPPIYTKGINPFYLTTDPQPIVLDDTAWVIGHIEEMADEFAHAKK